MDVNSINEAPASISNTESINVVEEEEKRHRELLNIQIFIKCTISIFFFTNCTTNLNFILCTIRPKIHKMYNTICKMYKFTICTQHIYCKFNFMLMSIRT